MTLLAMLPNLRTNNLNGLGATLTIMLRPILFLFADPDLRAKEASYRFNVPA